MSFKAPKMSALRSVCWRACRVGAAAFMLAAILGGCTDHSKSAAQQDRELREKSAQAAATVKAGAMETAAQTKEAADQAKRKLDAVAAGVQEGWNGKTGRLDLNVATVDQVAALPGIGRIKAQQIVKARPYGSTHDLVARGILSQGQFERISVQITAR